MVHYCWVLGCKNRSNKTDVRKVSYFGIPVQNPDRIREWLHKIGRSNFSSKPLQFFESKRICSEHFETTMLGVSNSKLKSNATPTIFNRECGYKGMNQIDAPSCSTVASEPVNKENKPPNNVDLPNRLVVSHDAPSCSTVASERVNKENKSSNNVDLPNQLVVVHDAPSCSSVVSTSQKQVQVNKKNKSLNVDLPTQLKTSKSSSTIRTNRLLAKIKALRRRNLRLEKALESQPKVTEEQFINFCKENFEENMAAFFEMQLHLAKYKGKGSRYPDTYKQFALSIYSLGGKAMYKFLQKQLQLPSEATLHRIAKK